MANDATFRDAILDRLRGDLLGPLTPSERLRSPRPSSRLPREGNPTDRYLTGLLWPPKIEQSGLDQEDVGSEVGSCGQADEGSNEGRVSTAGALRPSTCGLSFAIETVEGKQPSIMLVARGAFYQPGWVRHVEGKEPEDVSGEFPPDGGDSIEGIPEPPDTLFWQRVPLEVELPPIELNEGQMEPIDLAKVSGNPAASGLYIYLHVGSEVEIGGGQRIPPYDCSPYERARERE